MTRTYRTGIVQPKTHYKMLRSSSKSHAVR